MDFLLNKIDKHLDNHRSLDQNMKDLKRKLEDLNAMKEDTESRNRVELHPGKKLKKEVHLWLGNVERKNGEIQNLEQIVAESSTVSRGFHTENVLKMIKEVEELLQQGEFDQVGKAAENCMEEIWTCLMDDDIRKIGVWGMGGVGKTAIMKIINNQLLKEIKKFNSVIWITVSKEMNISKIQESISCAMGVTLPKDEPIRAGKLLEMLTKKGRYVLILDDLWDKLSPEEIGISEPSNGSKLVVTTRKLDVSLFRLSRSNNVHSSRTRCMEFVLGESR
ncbi:PREDICTED: disease resistance protein RFL1-like [Theobroma cacao]|uniref:Disease resistance protein RFL1-like n=1 Tax=Theobroma cacao TaxID=3641 RepID=A0AB32WL15_THECC|nr:PREDICTED: disease resistance protein RFL1-like [Theobroma cacao]